MNHSCLPNTVVHFRLNGQIVCTAVKDIAAGEEITVSYAGYLPQSVEWRRISLQSRWGFTCLCSHCVMQENSAASAGSEAHQKPVRVSSQSLSPMSKDISELVEVFEQFFEILVGDLGEDPLAKKLRTTWRCKLICCLTAERSIALLVRQRFGCHLTALFAQKQTIALLVILEMLLDFDITPVLNAKAACVLASLVQKEIFILPVEVMGYFVSRLLQHALVLEPTDLLLKAVLFTVQKDALPVEDILKLSVVYLLWFRKHPDWGKRILPNLRSAFALVPQFYVEVDEHVAISVLQVSYGLLTKTTKLMRCICAGSDNQHQKLGTEKELPVSVSPSN